MTRANNSRVAAFLAISMIASMIVVIPATPAHSASTELLISEYVEGSSLNKAIEIYNGTGAPVDLSTYTLELYSNGSATPSQDIELLGTLADGDVLVLAHASADPAILTVADVINSSVINFNGDDAVVLRNNGAVVDAFGQIGVDPGSEWPGGGQDDTLRRTENVCAGDTNPTDAFDASLEWNAFASDTFDGLGAHTVSCDDPPPPPATAVINEFSASTAGTDIEYVEVFGPPSTDLSHLTILEIEGDSGAATGTVDEVIPVGTTDAAGFWLADLPANALENGTITLLLVSDFTGSLNQDLDADNDGVFDTMPWAEIVDAVAVNDGGAGDLTYGEPVLTVGYDGLPFAPGGASRIPDGVDTDTVDDWVRNDFDLAGIGGFAGSPVEGEALNTPGEPNQLYEPPPLTLGECLDSATFIHEVQGAGGSSPLEGETVVVEGIVVGDFQNNGMPDNGDLNGFHVQEEDSDADVDPATSEGIFVYAPGADDVALGDQVRVLGPVSEFNGLTEITLAEMVVCSQANPLPAPTEVTLPVGSPDAFEAFEGMRVTFPQALTISEYFNYDRFGEIVLTDGRQFQPTAVHEPGSPEAGALADLNQRSRITLDDGRTSQNPDPAIHPNGEVFDLTNLFRGGDLVANVTGVMDYSFGLYRVQPTQGADYTAVNMRPENHDDVGDLEVASFNVLNYFTTIDDGSNNCGPGEDQNCRGADTPEELERQRAKIVAALKVMDSDVVGLIEIENHPDDAPTADLVAGLNDELGAGTYDFIETGAIGTDAIRQALIYKPGTVTPLGDYAILDTSVDPRFDDTKNRPVLAQTFRDNDTGGVFTVAVNHLKSKGSECGPGDDDPEQGNCNETRTRAAEAMVDWLASDPTGSGDEDFLIIGDLNAYDKEDPIDVLVAGGYTDLVYKYQGEFAYSYVFDGQLGYLDHGLANPGLVDEVTGATVWHINADEPDLIDYDTTFKQDAQDALYAPDPYRSSDHDPVIVGLGVCDEIAPEISVSVDKTVLWPPNHQYQKVRATVDASDNWTADPTVTLVSVTSNEPDNGEDDGNTVNDIVIVDDTTFKLRAERSGEGDGRVYTITYQVTDDCGNTAEGTATVTVPLSLGRQSGNQGWGPSNRFVRLPW
jgi:uncharacterized protein